jgi:hypothetical protein
VIAPKNGEADDEADCARHAEDAVAEDLQGQDRLGSARLGEHEPSEQAEASYEHRDHRGRVPGIGGPSEARVKDDCRQTTREQRCAEVVDRVLDLLAGSLERRRDHYQRDEADRDVDVEDPTPGEVVDEEAAEQRADHRRDAEHCTEEALVAAAVAWRDDVADDGDRRHEQAASTEPLDRAEDDQLRHVLADAAQRRAHEKDHDRRLQHDLSAVLVAQLSVEGANDRRREQVGSDDPRELGDPSEVADDRRQRRRDDRLIERRKSRTSNSALKMRRTGCRSALAAVTLAAKLSSSRDRGGELYSGRLGELRECGHQRLQLTTALRQAVLDTWRACVDDFTLENAGLFQVDKTLREGRRRDASECVQELVEPHRALV